MKCLRAALLTLRLRVRLFPRGMFDAALQRCSLAHLRTRSTASGQAAFIDIGRHVIGRGLDFRHGISHGDTEGGAFDQVQIVHAVADSRGVFPEA